MHVNLVDEFEVLNAINEWKAKGALVEANFVNDIN